MTFANLLSHYTPMMANIGLLSLVAWVFMSFNLRFKPFRAEGMLSSRANLGLLFGTASVLVMLIPFQVDEGVFADTRGVLMLAAGLIGGWVSAFISVLISSVFRWYVGGAGVFPGILFIVIFAVIGVVAHYYCLSRNLFRFRARQVLGLCLVGCTASLPSIFLLPPELREAVLTGLFPQIFIANTLGGLVLSGLLIREDNREQERSLLESSRQALQQKELMLRGMLDSMPAEVALIAPDGRVQYVNSAWEQFEQDTKGDEQQYYLGTNYLEVCRLNPDEPDYESACRVLEGMQKLLGTEAEPFEQIYPCHSPTRKRWFKLIANPVADVPGVSAVAMHLDVTELIEAQHALESAKEKAESANVAKTIFLSSMSHELTTPLHSILGFAQLLAGDKNSHLTQRQEQSLNQVLEAGKTLLELVTQLLDFSRIELGKDHPVIEQVPLSSVIEACVGMVKYEAVTRGIRLEYMTGEYHDLMLYTDKSRIRHVLINLLTNAIKYSPDHALVKISYEKRGDSFLRIIVQDSGMGIPYDKQQEVFEPFSRLGRETGNIQGTGIGLTIARQLIESLGGTIDFRSSEGEGSRFWVDVPLQPRQIKAGIAG